MTTERLYIEEIQTVLPYRDPRSVKRWCDKNHVRILSDRGTKKRFVLKEEFEKEIERNNRGESSGNHSAVRVMKKKKNTDLARNYKPQGENENKILSIFTSLL